MAVSYTETYTDGATDLLAGATWAAAAKVLVSDQTQDIDTNLDVSTNAIDLVHFVGGGPRVVTSGGGAAAFKIDNTYTTDPNFVWLCNGGYIKFEFKTNACPLAVVGGGTVIVNAGTITRLVVNGGTVHIEAGATVSELVLSSGTVKAFSDIPTVYQSGGQLNAIARIGATKYVLSGGQGRIENTTGSNMTLLELESAGVFVPVAGSVDTINRRGGTIAYSAAQRSITLGVTAFTNYAGDTPRDTGMVTISNLVDYAKYSIGGGAVKV